jgi:multiple sugar transport system ATP-binding protein
MSISDVMVVMKEGVLQQMGAPQEIYDRPVNLFVAMFLGTPQIAVFDGRIENGALYIGEDKVINIRKIDGNSFENAAVTVAVRPEGFIPDPAGPLHMKLKLLEVMGRDTSAVIYNEAQKSENVSAIISGDTVVDTAAKEMLFSLKTGKVHLFDTSTGNRIPFKSV